MYKYFVKLHLVVSEDLSFFLLIETQTQQASNLGAFPLCPFSVPIDDMVWASYLTSLGGMTLSTSANRPIPSLLLPAMKVRAEALEPL